MTLLITWPSRCLSHPSLFKPSLFYVKEGFCNSGFCEIAPTNPVCLLGKLSKDRRVMAYPFHLYSPSIDQVGMYCWWLCDRTIHCISSVVVWSNISHLPSLVHLVKCSIDSLQWQQQEHMLDTRGSILDRCLLDVPEACLVTQTLYFITRHSLFQCTQSKYLCGIILFWAKRSLATLQPHAWNLVALIDVFALFLSIITWMVSCRKYGLHCLVSSASTKASLASLSAIILSCSGRDRSKNSVVSSMWLCTRW